MTGRHIGKSAWIAVFPRGRMGCRMHKNRKADMYIMCNGQAVLFVLKYKLLHYGLMEIMVENAERMNKK